MGIQKKSQAKKPSFATITEKGATPKIHKIYLYPAVYIYIYMYIDVYIYTSRGSQAKPSFCHTQYLNMARMAAKAGENHEGNALVRHLLPKIAEEQGWVENEATVERVHEALSGALFLRRQGTSGNSGRWNEFHWSFGERRKEFSLLLLILISYGINMGYVQQADAPVLTSLQTQAQRASNRASEAKTLKEAKQRIGDFFSRCQNKLHVATVCLSNSSLMERLHVWHFASNPLWGPRYKTLLRYEVFSKSKCSEGFLSRSH